MTTATLPTLAMPAPALPARRAHTHRPARHGWATHGVHLAVNAAGELAIEIPGALYAGIAGWRTSQTWLAAFHAHPRLAEAARRYETCAETLYRVMTAVVPYADPTTGRGIRVAHATVARQLGVSAKVVQRCCWAAEDLGLLERVLDGSDMTLSMRGKIRDYYGHRDQPAARPDGTRRRRGTQSKLPNVYAATLPRWMASRTPGLRPKPVRGTTFAGVLVDNYPRPTVLQSCRVHPPVGDPPTPNHSVSLLSPTTTFATSCGKPPAPQRTTDTTAASRPTKARQKTGFDRPRRRLDPAVERFARALRRDLLGFRSVSLYRICPGLSLYVSAGLSVSDLTRGLNNYLADVGRTWLTQWNPGQTEQQARYLIGMLTRARMAGYIRLPDPDDTFDDGW